MQPSSTVYPQEAWDAGYQNLPFEKVGEQDHIRQWLIQNALAYFHGASGTQGKDCFEAGCFPGRYLAALGDLGFRLNGIDATPRVKKEMPDWLKSQGYSTGWTEQGDFFALQPDRTYDLVYSLGFIEHFEDWRSAIRKHCELVKPGGLLLIVVPNFAGALQNLLHRWLDPLNYSRHYIPSMNPNLWRPEVEAMGLEIVEASYFPEFDFWIGEQKRNMAQKLAFYVIRTLIPVLKKVLPKNSAFCAPYVGLVAKK